jgi:hypothetical protein
MAENPDRPGHGSGMPYSDRNGAVVGIVTVAQGEPHLLPADNYLAETIDIVTKKLMGEHRSKRALVKTYMAANPEERISIIFRGVMVTLALVISPSQEPIRARPEFDSRRESILFASVALAAST